MFNNEGSSLFPASCQARNRTRQDRTGQDRQGQAWTGISFADATQNKPNYTLLSLSLFPDTYKENQPHGGVANGRNSPWLARKRPGERERERRRGGATGGSRTSKASARAKFVRFTGRNIILLYVQYFLCCACSQFWEPIKAFKESFPTAPTPSSAPVHVPIWELLIRPNAWQILVGNFPGKLAKKNMTNTTQIISKTAGIPYKSSGLW